MVSFRLALRPTRHCCYTVSALCRWNLRNNVPQCEDLQQATRLIHNTGLCLQPQTKVQTNRTGNSSATWTYGFT